MADQAELDRLQRTVEALERRVDELERTVAEQKLPPPPAVTPAPPVPARPALAPLAPEASQARATSPASDSETGEWVILEPMPAAPQHVPVAQPIEPPPAKPWAPINPKASPTPAPAAPRDPSQTLEATIGLKWAAWIGGIVFVLGVLFFLKYAWDQGWIELTPTMRVVAAIVAGVAISGLGERMHRRNVPVLAATLHGAGLAIVLASFFAAYSLFRPEERVLGVTGAFVGVCITALIGILLSLHIQTIILAVIALIGAYIAPFILNTGQDRSAALLAYVGVLSAVAWVLSYLKPRWGGIRILAWIGTFGTFALWWFELGQKNNHHVLAVTWLAIYFLGFLLEMLLTLRKIGSDRSLAILDSLCSIMVLVLMAATFGLLFAIFRTGQDRSAAWLACVGALSAVAWILSYLKPSWVGIRILSWIGTFGTFVFWWHELGERNDHHALAVSWLAVYFIGFLVEMILTLRKTEPQGPSAALDTICPMLSLLNSAATFALLRTIFDGKSYNTTLGVVAILIAAIQAAATFATRSRAFSISSLLQSAALVTLAVPLILDQFAITLAWLALAVALAALAWQLNLPAARSWAVILLLLGIIRLALFDLKLRGNMVISTSVFSISQWMLMAWSTAVLAHAIAWMRTGTPGRIPALEQRFARIIPPPSQWAPRASQGVLNYAQPLGRLAPPNVDPGGVLISILGTVVYVAACLSQYRGSTLTLLLLLWSIPMIALAPFGRALGYLWHATIVAAVFGIRWLAVDGINPLVQHWSIPEPAEVLRPLLNFVTFNGLLLCGIVAALILQLRRIKPESAPERRALFVWIGLVILAMLNFEACRTVDWIKVNGGAIRDPGIVKHGVISVLWALVGFAGVSFGFRRKIAPMRIAALVLLGVTLAKILIIDMAEVKAVWRILSFVAVGGLLLAVSFVYHQQVQAKKAQI